MHFPTQELTHTVASIRTKEAIEEDFINTSSLNEKCLVHVGKTCWEGNIVPTYKELVNKAHC